MLHSTLKMILKQGDKNAMQGLLEMVSSVDKCMREWLASRRSQAKIFLSGVLAGLFLSYVAARVPQAVSYWEIRTPVRALRHEADGYGLSYEDVLKKPSQAAGKPIRWFLTHPNSSAWLYQGDAAKPIVWAGQPPDMVETGQSGMSHGEDVVAYVVGSTPQGVVLRAFSVARTEKIETNFRVTR